MQGGALDQPVRLTNDIRLLRRYKLAYDMVHKRGQFEGQKDFEAPWWATDLVGEVVDARDEYEQQLEADQEHSSALGAGLDSPEMR